MTGRIVLDVVGHPRPQGSKRAFTHPSTGRAVMAESSGAGLVTWREDVKQAALTWLRDHPDQAPFTGPVRVTAAFRFHRPKAHWRTGANAGLLRGTAPVYPTSRAVGDIEKLVRSTHDAITAAGIWADDSQVVALLTAKVYAAPGQPEGARIYIRPYAATIAERDAQEATS